MAYEMRAYPTQLMLRVHAEVLSGRLPCYPGCTTKLSRYSIARYSSHKGRRCSSAASSTWYGGTRHSAASISWITQRSA